MLKLTRGIQDSVQIGDDIVVTILGVVGRKVKIGIEAPRNVPILRDDAKVDTPAKRVQS
jgi:carbon storage regulator